MTPTQPRRYTRWTPADDARLRRLAARSTAARIAHLMGRTETAVWTRAWEQGISLRKRGEYNPNYRHPRALVLDVLRRYYTDGQSVRDIGAAVGLAVGTVTKYVNGICRADVREEFMRK